MRSRSSQRPREACGAVHAGARPQVRWPRVSRGGRLVTEVRRQRQSSSPQPDERGRAVPLSPWLQSRFRADSAPLSTRPFQRPGRSLKADWLDERPTSNGAVWITGDDILPPGTPGGGGCSAAGPPSPPPSPRDLQRCLKVRPVGSACARHRAPPRYTKCACGRTLTDHSHNKLYIISGERGTVALRHEARCTCQCCPGLLSARPMGGRCLCCCGMPHGLSLIHISEPTRPY